MYVRRSGVMAIVCLLSACGGGGGESAGENAPVQLPSGPKTYVASAATVGDYYTYKEVTKVDAQDESTVYSTRMANRVASDGAKTIKYNSDLVISTQPLMFDSSTSADELDGEGRLVSFTEAGCSVTNKPPYHYVAPYTIMAGLSWQHAGTIETKCGTSNPRQSTVDYKNTVGGALEQVSVPAGTFSAFKVTRNSSSEGTTSTTVTERNCWWEPNLGVELKCVATTVSTNKTTGAKRTITYNQELHGFANQKLARKFDTVLRFVGTWKGNFSGPANGTCELQFGLDGAINGSCTGSGIAFNVLGKIEADGKLAFNLASGGVVGQTFTGKVDNLQQISGVWGVPGLGNGTWLITQD